MNALVYSSAANYAYQQEPEIVEFVKEDFPNLLSKIHVSYRETLKKLSLPENYYVPPKRYDKDNHTEEEYLVEYKLHLPFFVNSFYKYIKDFQEIPSCEEFVCAYYNDNRDFLNKYRTAAFNEAITNRCKRAYPSILRDIMFALKLDNYMLSEGRNIDIIYNESLDRDENIDIMICGRKNYGIHLFTNTQRAIEFRNMKDGRHGRDFDNVIDVDFTIDLGRRRETYGNIKLYDDDDMNDLFRTLANYK